MEKTGEQMIVSRSYDVLFGVASRLSISPHSSIPHSRLSPLSRLLAHNSRQLSWHIDRPRSRDCPAKVVKTTEMPRRTRVGDRMEKSRIYSGTAGRD
ncbi:hypothetical protein L484_021789 [Morus notabilis]|uniref:Uncharacterized protein n=1 Tax=Morus notabilis TaxID=981085 RepID=W9QSM6_9ROSA|nr:hypothetical protein L484_021789 [Morus notabilis]